MKEKKIIILTAILNFISAALKLGLGLFFSFSTLIADSIQSFLDFFTDIISFIANKIGKRRANKTYPFGYGQVYYLSNLLTGILLFLIGAFIIYQLFAFNTKFVPNLFILVALLFVLAIKGFVIFILQKNAKSTKSGLLIESYKESRTDFLSTCVVIGILVISFFEKYIPSYINVDKIGSLFMAIYIFYTSIKIIISNIRGILINDESNDEIKEEIRKELEHFKDLTIINIRIIRISFYYSVDLQLDVNNNITIKEYLRIERKIKKRLKSLNKLIKYIDIEVK